MKALLQCYQAREFFTIPPPTTPDYRLTHIQVEWLEIWLPCDAAGDNTLRYLWALRVTSVRYRHRHEMMNLRFANTSKVRFQEGGEGAA